MDSTPKTSEELIKELKALQAKYDLLLASIDSEASKSKPAPGSISEDNNQFRSLFDKAADAIFIADEDSGKILDANLTASNWMGVPVDEIIGLHQTMLHPAEKRDLSKKTFSKSRIDLSVQDFTIPYENELVTKDKGEIRVEVLASKVKYKGKNCLMGIFRDISERKEAELLIKRSEERFRTLSSITTEGIMIHENGIIIDANEAFAKILGYSGPEELLGQNGFEILNFSPKSRSIVKDHIQRNSEETYDIEIINKAGKNIPAETRGSSIIYQGKTARLVYMRDISERKQAREDLRKIEALQSKMVANIGDVIVIIDPLSTIKFNSINITRLFGWKPEETIGREALDFVHEDDLAKVESFFSSLLNEYCGTGSCEFRYKCKDGEFKWIEFTGTNLSHDPDINGLLGNFKEITDRKKYEDEIIAAKEKAEESDKLKSSFLSNMSHEIRTPMNGILGFADLLKSPNLSGEEEKEYIDIIQKSGDRMLNLINDLIDISRIEAGQVEINYSKTNINEKLNFLLRFFKSEAELKGIELTLDANLPSDAANIITDKDKLYAILTNLIKNAIKFTKQGHVEFGYNKKGNKLEFFVRDTGIGIAKDKLNSIFDRFVQADLRTSSGYEGTGLGLSISKAYVEMLEGEIWISSKLGKGSVFYFNIPYNTDSVESLKNDIAKDFKHSLGNNQDNYKILIAEDDPTSMLYLKSVLKRKNLNIIEAKNGLEAIDACKKHNNLALVFMDIKMKKMDGYSATKFIKKKFPNLPVVAQTSYALKSEKEKFTDVFDFYITKPIKVQDVKDILKMTLDYNW